MSELRLVNLVKKFDGAAAVDGLSLDVSSGEFVVILGPSGCGKTTTLRCVAGLEVPDEGDIMIDNDSVSGLPPKERDIAMVFQNYALYPHMTVAENIAYPLKMKKTAKDEIERRVKEIGELLGLSHLLGRKPRQLSGGEQQRVALGRAIVRRPKVFLLDEPLSNLDAKLRLFTRAELKRLQRELRVTTVYVTHDQAEAMALADRVAVMNNGKLLQYAPPTEIYGRPNTVFVAGFIGNPPMNLIRARLTVDRELVRVSSDCFNFELSEGLAKNVKNLNEKEVLVGLRAEDLAISEARSDESVFQADLYLVEHLGANVMLDLKANQSLLKCVASNASEARAGAKVWVGFDQSQLHLFDLKTEKALV